MKYPPKNDLMVRAIPTPLEFDDHVHSMLVLRVRAAPWISPAAIHVSSDGSSYLQVCDSLGHVVGGKLLEPMVGGVEIQEDGPLMRIAGPDAAILRVLSESDWKLGRQPMLIEDEWCFVRQLIATGGDRYRPMGILRGRMGTPALAHDHGSEAFLADARMLHPIRDSAVRPGRRIWIKTQPTGSQVLPLTKARAWQFDLPPRPAVCYISEGDNHDSF